MITETWVHYANAGRTASVLDWLTRFPSEVLDADRRLLLVKAWVVALCGREDEMHRVASEVRVLGGLEDGPLPDGMASVESSLSVLSATFAWGDVGAVLDHGARSAALEGPASPWYPVLTRALGWAHYCNDELDLAERRLQETVALAPSAEQWIVAVASIADLSLIAGMRGRRGEQTRLAEEAVDLVRERGLLDSVEVGEVHTARGVALAAQGHPEAALPELEQGVMLRRLWAQQLDLVDGLTAISSARAAMTARPPLPDAPGSDCSASAHSHAAKHTRRSHRSSSATSRAQQSHMAWLVSSSCHRRSPSCAAGSVERQMSVNENRGKHAIALGRLGLPGHGLLDLGEQRVDDWLLAGDLGALGGHRLAGGCERL